MKALKQYIDEENNWAEFFKRPVLDINTITDAIAQDLFQTLDNKLSPENLTCDGEAKRSVVQRRYKLFTGAIKDLQKLGFQPKEQMYSI